MCVFGMVYAGVREVGEVLQVGLEVLAILDKSYAWALMYIPASTAIQSGSETTQKSNALLSQLWLRMVLHWLGQQDWFQRQYKSTTYALCNYI